MDGSKRGRRVPVDVGGCSRCGPRLVLARPGTATGHACRRRSRSAVWAARGHELPSIYEWNLEFVRTVLCDSNRSLHPYLAEQFKALDEVYVFDPMDAAPYPTYRFLRNAHYPSGLITNSYGWRGADVSLNKPAGSVRIAFVGASTTAEAHGDPFSYRNTSAGGFANGLCGGIPRSQSM